MFSRTMLYCDASSPGRHSVKVMLHADAFGGFEFAARFVCLLIKSLLADAVALKAKRQPV